MSLKEKRHQKKCYQQSTQNQPVQCLHINWYHIVLGTPSVSKTFCGKKPGEQKASTVSNFACTLRHLHHTIPYAYNLADVEQTSPSAIALVHCDRCTSLSLALISLSSCHTESLQDFQSCLFTGNNQPEHYGMSNWSEDSTDLWVRIYIHTILWPIRHAQHICPFAVGSGITLPTLLRWLYSPKWRRQHQTNLLCSK